jgi:hypothetical protein
VAAAHPLPQLRLPAGGSEARLRHPAWPALLRQQVGADAPPAPRPTAAAWERRLHRWTALRPLPSWRTTARCTCRSCPEQSVARLRNFAAKLDIRGLGPKTVDLLLAARPGLEPPDLYALTLAGGTCALHRGWALPYACCSAAAVCPAAAHRSCAMPPQGPLAEQGAHSLAQQGLPRPRPGRSLGRPPC